MDSMNGYTSDDYDDDLLEEQYENEILEKRKIFNERYSQNDKASPYPENQYECLRKLNKGFYGKVNLVRDRKSGRELAIKILSKEHIIKTNSVNKSKSERQILGSLDHPFIVKMIHSYKDSKNLYLLMEYCSGSDMYEYLDRMVILPEDQILFFGAQVFMALDFMHNLGLIYRDLKPENIMLNADGYLKLTDFGFAKKIVSRTFSFNCTLQYCAPELMRQRLMGPKEFRSGYDKSVDWWSYGVLLYEMFCGRVPFEITSVDMKFYYKTIQYPDTISHVLKDLIRNLLQSDVPNRLGCKSQGSQEIKLHEFFKSMDWKRLYFKKIQAPRLPHSKNELPSESQFGSGCSVDSAGTSEPQKDCNVENWMELTDHEFEDF